MKIKRFFNNWPRVTRNLQPSLSNSYHYLTQLCKLTNCLVFNIMFTKNLSRYMFMMTPLLYPKFIYLKPKKYIQQKIQELVIFQIVLFSMLLYLCSYTHHIVSIIIIILSNTIQFIIGISNLLSSILLTFLNQMNIQFVFRLLSKY